MLITVVTACYNSERYISENITSILKQSYQNFEQIIIDKLSSDRTIEIANELYTKHECNNKLKIFSQLDNGIADAFNKGIQHASGDIITFLNSDDKYYTNIVFERVIEVFINYGQTLFVHGNVYFEDPAYGSLIKTPRGKTLRDGMIFNHPTIFYKKKLFTEFGYFNTAFQFSMDFEHLCRLETKIPNLLNLIKYLNNPPLVYMQYGGATWEFPIKALNETKKCLKSLELWNMRAKTIFLLNVFKTYFKKILLLFHLNSLLGKIRKIKWKYLTYNHFKT